MAVDVETTGFIPGYHDIVQIAVLPLDTDFTILKKVVPFYMDIKPKRPHTIDQKAMHVSRLDFARLMQRALDPWDAAQLFDQWFEGLKRDNDKRKAVLPDGKRLLPVAQNWCFDRCFIIDWLDGISDPMNGEYVNFDSIFHPWYRDTLATAQYLNDSYVMDINCVMDWKVPFPKSNLSYICSQLKIKNNKPHDALQDSVVTAEAYRKMCLRQIP